ncbi:DNA recombination protein RmuC [Marihabitans asiaticum]|uniref:DNA recombination protein RmuC n=1 Tax=Marihabitans asiaticum TaxID=415218 RepID=A0A560WIA3_9MICO|nr:DNA recombination protein RmuC [Marihabitans asiaticum]TWD17270.1 DNA recombination protein RmuC [Marihabitans asiaticum]
MDITTLLVGLVIGAALGAALAWGYARGSVLSARTEAVLGAASAREELAAATSERDVLRARVVDLEATVADDAQTAAALRPVQDALARVSTQVQTLERDRVDQFAGVRDALVRLEESTATVGRETQSLAGSLRVSSVRGQWGETQLRRVLEVSGMLPRCDFEEQARGTNTAGEGVNPDVVVRLPGEKQLVIDAKAPMSDWLAAHGEDVSDEQRAAALSRHAKALRSHVRTLAAKEYWTAFEPSPEMVVCFVPTDATLAAALSADPSLHEEAMRERVVLTSPATLLALLRTIAYTWQQDALTRSAQELLDVGRELYQRLGTLGDRTSAMGKSLARSVEAYNALVGTLESRVFVSARRMTDIGLSTDAIAELEPVETAPRALSAPELVEELDLAAGPHGRPELDLDQRPQPDDRFSARASGTPGR